jgi:SAM-dependent methyltransferase
VTDFVRLYSKQEYMTPGAAETVEIVAKTVQPDEHVVLLDMASGKGEAAATLAGRCGCRVVAVEPYDPFVHYSAAKFWFFNLRDLVSVVRADGGRLPVRDCIMDAAYCIGAPSIVGLRRALRELTRVVKPGAAVVVSDITWRERPGPLGDEWRWLAAAKQITAEEYSATIAEAGLGVERIHTHNGQAWADYWAPMLEVAEEAKTSQPADVFFADDVESGVEMERRAVEAWLDYTTFVARKSSKRSAVTISARPRL